MLTGPARMGCVTWKMLGQSFRPLGSKFCLIDGLIALYTALGAPSRGLSFVMDNDGKRLIIDLPSGLPYLEGKVGVLVVSGSVDGSKPPTRSKSALGMSMQAPEQ